MKTQQRTLRLFGSWLRSVTGTARRSCFDFLLAVTFFGLAGRLDAAERITEPIDLRTDVRERPDLPERGPHHRVWTTTETAKDAEGRQSTRPGRYIQLESGLHYWDTDHWAESKEDIELVPDVGAVARQGPVSVIWNANLNSEASVELITPDSKRLRSNILGIGYYDAKSGESVLIAEVQDCAGEFLPPNEIFYPNAFDKVKATVRYRYRKGSFEQDVILEERLAPPEAYGLNPETTRLEVLTEFIDPPQATRSRSVIKREMDPSKRAAMVEPDLSDERISFGEVQIGFGRAFELSDEAGAPIRTKGTQIVVKEWQTIGDRTVLVESVEHSAIKQHLDKLPASRVAAVDVRPGKSRLLPGKRIASVPESGTGRSIQLASKRYGPEGYVIDYQTVVGPEDWTFSENTTYLVTGSVTLRGTTTVSSGAVVKFASGANILVTDGTFVSPSAAAYFTSADDPTAAYDSPTSTGTGAAAIAAGSPCLTFNLTGPATVSNLEFRNVVTALSFMHSGIGFNNLVENCTFRSCNVAIQSDTSAGSWQNVGECNVGLFYNDTGGGVSFTPSARGSACDDFAAL